MWLLGTSNYLNEVLLGGTDELIFFNFGEMMTYSYIQTDCPYEAVAN